MPYRSLLCKGLFPKFVNKKISLLKRIKTLHAARAISFSLRIALRGVGGGIQG
jgi:hypothetical protein